jgi:hypothetical protein
MMNPCKKYLMLASAALLALGGCTTTYVTPVAVTTLRRVDTSAGQDQGASSKTFTLPNDWQFSVWVIKRGANIVFNADGTGTFSGVIYAHQTASAYGDMLHLQSIQYGRDGNRLFTFPGNDIGAAMGLRAPFRDFPYDVAFGFDPRQFERIDSVKWYARLRMLDQNIGHPHAKRTSQVGDTVAGSPVPPRLLPAQP